ncbi:UNKNOWN [Stylonychia lemnae]|uniref:non-specific serine/threonine protein kinase n=1 Tax=Stylonychia lemnae TaxID=5949 RepID=A0A078AW00_STYLE|nr:UNKNOWN [Stylonychia lemnae]|eukprot:CDW86640.1 UNKNOWN [Stylonychia lemnae]
MENYDSLNSPWETLYQTVNVERPKDYSYYQQLSIKWGNQDNYQLIHKLGRGKYSEVYEGACLLNNQKCVVKILKPVRTEKIFREIKILQTLFGGPNIVKLYDVTKDPSSKTPSLIYEYIPNIESKILFQKLTDTDIRIYLYKLLEALDYSHQQGIMHRDVKPLNIVINHETQDLRLIDWGLADFYHAGQEYNVRVASRYYKGPELLVEDKLYHYSLDIWSLGCTMATMMLRVDPFFKGSDNYDQLIKIAKVMGTEDLREYVRKYKLNIPQQITKVLKNYPKVEFEEFINKNNKSVVTELGLDLLKRMLVYDKNQRITPKDAMKHPYFDPVKATLSKQSSK